MAPFVKDQSTVLQDREHELLKQLDKGIDDMEQGRVVPLDKSLERIREKFGLYEV